VVRTNFKNKNILRAKGITLTKIVEPKTKPIICTTKTGTGHSYKVCMK
jgi:hypothetical protein